MTTWSDEPTSEPRRGQLHCVPAASGRGATVTPLSRRTEAKRLTSVRERVEELARRQATARAGEDPRGTERQHAKGKLTVRERLTLLLDEGSFTEIESLRRHRATGFGLEKRRPYADGVVTGWGLVHGRRVFVYASDFRSFGGSVGEAHASKIHKLLDLAILAGAPVVSLNDGGGARIQEGVLALAGYGGIFRRNVQASGVIPQISVVLGPCAGGASYSPALTDFVFMVRGVSHMFLTGPDVVGKVTGEVVSHDELGGGDIHAEKSGVATFLYEDEQSCLQDVRYLLSMLPANSAEQPPAFPPDDDPDRRCEELLDLVPSDPQQPYDMRRVVAELVDSGEYLELQEDFAPNVLCALARLDGHVVGLVGNQPLVNAGVLDISAAEKAARFVRTCDAFNIPIVTLVDVPGFLPGVAQEHNGVIRHGAKLLYAYCEATVPRVQVILRKAYGGAYIVMDSRSIGSDVSFAWPTNEIAVMGAAGAVGILHRAELAEARDPEPLRGRLAEAYVEELAHPYYAAERGLVDEVIDPAETRRALISALSMLRDKAVAPLPRKHGNPPL